MGFFSRWTFCREFRKQEPARSSGDIEGLSEWQRSRIMEVQRDVGFAILKRDVGEPDVFCDFEAARRSGHYKLLADEIVEVRWRKNFFEGGRLDAVFIRPAR